MDTHVVVLSLGATPALLRALTADVPPGEAWTPPKPGEWSIAEVVRHLVEGEGDTFLPRLTRMRAETRPLFESRRRAGGDGADLGTLLDAFEAARRRSTAILASLDAHGWRREGVSPSRGVLTVAEYARSMAEHDTEHLRQIHDVREVLGLPPKHCEAHVALPLAEIIARLAPTPARLGAVAAGLAATALRRRPAEDEWSMKEVMAHLFKVERDVFLPRLRRMASEERPVFERFDPDAWAAERDHREGSFAADLEAFAAARRETLAFLEALPLAAAARLGISAVFGPVRLDRYATHVVDHDVEHLAQMARCRAALPHAPGMTRPVSPGVQKVQAALEGLGVAHRLVQLDQPARTSAEAARAVGCRVGQIAKSLVFRGRESARAILVIASGANRVDERKLAALVSEPMEKADADFVRARTGFAIGGIAPVAHIEPLTTFIDQDLLRWSEIWAAAGHPSAVFSLTGADLVRITNGRVVSVT